MSHSVQAQWVTPWDKAADTPRNYVGKQAIAGEDVEAGAFVYLAAGNIVMLAAKSSLVASQVVGIALNSAVEGQPIQYGETGYYRVRGPGYAEFLVGYPMFAGAAGVAASYNELSAGDWVTWLGCLYHAEFLAFEPCITGLQWPSGSTGIYSITGSDVKPVIATDTGRYLAHAGATLTPGRLAGVSLSTGAATILSNSTLPDTIGDIGLILNNPTAGQPVQVMRAGEVYVGAGKFPGAGRPLVPTTLGLLRDATTITANSATILAGYSTGTDRMMVAIRNTKCRAGHGG